MTSQSSRTTQPEDPESLAADPALRGDTGPGRRFGQLTYTNFDGGVANGWQVKQEVDLDPAEVTVLRSGIDAQLDPGYELPRYPSPEDLAWFPHRLVFAGLSAATSTDAAGVVWWHHALAGADGAGRPGNVYIHALLDRAPTQQDADFAGAARPIDWWRSPDWLTPYGQNAVRDSTVAAAPGPGEQVSATRVIDFLLDPDVDRLGVLTLLLDACAAALAGGPPVVLGTQNTDTAALWIGTITHLTSAAVARSLGFSTLERSSSLDSRLRQGALLCCVPLGDLVEISTRDRAYVVVDETEFASTGDLDGSPHVTAAGDRIAVTEWSSLARVMMYDHGHAAYALDQLNRLAVPAPAHPGWPLALVVALDPETFDDGAAEAARLLVRWTPTSLADPELAAARALVERQTTGDYATAEQAWRMLVPTRQPGHATSPLAETVLRMYVTLALQDPLWLTQPGGPPVPSGSWTTALVDDHLEQTALTSVDRLAELSPTDPIAAGIVIGTAQLLLSLGLRHAGLIQRLQDQAARLIAERLRDEPEGLLEQLGPAPEPVLREVVRPAVTPNLREWQRPLGHQLPWPALDWLYREQSGPVVPIRAGSQDDLELAIEYAYQRAMTDPQRYDADRVLAATSALAARVDPEELRPMLSHPPLTLAQLHAIENDASHRWNTPRLPWEYFGPVLISADSAYPMPELCLLLAERRVVPPEPPEAQLARMRALIGRPWWRDAVGASVNLRTVLRGGLAIQSLPEVRPARDVVDALRVAMILAGVVDADLPELDRLLRRRTVPGGQVGGATKTQILEGLQDVPLSVVAITAMIGDPRFPADELGTPAARWAHTVEVAADDGPIPVLRRVVGIDAERGRPTYARLLDDINNRLWSMLAGSENRERAVRACEKFAVAWVRPLYPGDGLLSRLRGAP